MSATAEHIDADLQRQRQELLRDKLRTIISGLKEEAEDRVNRREAIERRWLTDLRQYHGHYDDAILKELKEAKKSTLFINQTRPKTNALEARLSDMLFPTDDRNWGIEPTPVPELAIEAEDAAKAAADAALAVSDNEDDPARQEAASEADERLKAIRTRLDEARRRARFMQEEIDDHLRECQYSTQARNVIRDGTRIGTGVVKGPIADGRAHQSWQLRTVQDDVEEGQEEDEAPQVRDEFQLVTEEDKRPVFWRVDPWQFFPDIDVDDIVDSEGVFERHLLNKKAMRRLARTPGFNAAAIRRVLKSYEPIDVPTYLAELRTISESYHDTLKGTYQVWEYHGPLTGKDITALAEILDQPEILEDAGLIDGDEETDPLDEIHAVVWFCEDEIFKFGLHHLDSNETIYSVFNLEKDEASVFGFGLPYIMRDSQKSLNGAWRMMMDNAGLGTGPQIVIDEEVVEPVDGDWTLTPRKLWRKRTGKQLPDNKKPFEVFNINMHQEELANIIDLSKRNIDEETAMPMIAQGEQGTQVTKTAQGMSMLMNSVNVVFRRIVKNWDDDVTTPNIRRMYHWLMQFSPKEEIKGDYQVDARGTSVLLVREMQSANLMVFLGNFAAHPVLAKYLKQEGLPALRQLATTMMIPADQIVKTDEEVREDEAKAAREDPPVDPEMEKIAAQLNLEKMRGDNALVLEEMRRETALIELAQTSNMKLEELRAMLQSKREDRASKERLFAAEAALTKRPSTGGGGYL